MKKKAIVVLAVFSLAAWMVGTGFSAMIANSAPETASTPAPQTQVQTQATPDYGPHGPWMMDGNNMPHGMSYGMMGGGMHGAMMGPGSNGSGTSWQRMWDQCRQIWAGHDGTEGGAATGSPRG